MFNKEFLDELTRSNVLALDIATHCGYYHPAEAGTWDLAKIAKKRGCGIHKAFADTLYDFCAKNKVKMIVAEDVNAGAGAHFMAIRKLSELRGVLYLLAEDMEIPEPCFANITTVKKWATGNGRADKKMMIEACKSRWHIDPIDDNMADATHIYKWFVRTYNIKKEAQNELTEKIQATGGEK